MSDKEKQTQRASVKWGSDQGEDARQTIAAPVPELPPLEGVYGETKDDYILALNRRELQLRAAHARIAEREKELAAMTEDRNLWRDAHNDDCPNLARIAELGEELSTAKSLHFAAESEIDDALDKLGLEGDARDVTLGFAVESALAAKIVGPELPPDEYLYGHVNHILVDEFGLGDFSRPVRDFEELEATRKAAIRYLTELRAARARIADLEKELGGQFHAAKTFAELVVKYQSQESDLKRLRDAVAAFLAAWDGDGDHEETVRPAIESLRSACGEGI